MKVAIYARVSTLDQDPSKQLADCRAFCKSRGYEIEGEYLEKVSGYKQNVARPEYDLVKKKAHRGDIQAVVVWAFDRWCRNRDTMIEDVVVLRQYGCKLHSVREEWLEAINIDGAIGRTIQDFLLGMVGSMAELESQRRSDRVKMAYSNKKGRWGRRSLPKRVVQEVLEYHNQGKSFRWIANNVQYYDKNKNQRKISLGSVHKIIAEFTQKKDM